MRRRDPRRWPRALAVVGAALLVAALGAPLATQARPAQSADQQFGGFILSARANGAQLSYDSPGLLPVGSPLFQLSIPEALATGSNGPVGYALASFVYPGPLIADLGAALALTGNDAPIPAYPVRSQAFFPGGPTEESNGEQGSEMTALTAENDYRAIASYQSLQVPPAISIGSMRATSQSTIEGAQVVTRARSEVSDVAIFAGLIQIESVVTDIIATSNGEAAASAGQTTVSGVTVAGQPATVDGDGIRFADGGGPDSDDDQPGEDPTGGQLDPVGDGLGEAVEPVDENLGGPLNDILDQIGAAGDDALQQLFDQAGIEIRVLDPIESNEGGTVERTANGLFVQIDYDGRDSGLLTDLLFAVPSDQLPGQELIPGTPTSPQGLFNLLKERHISGFAIGPANVSALATPPFEIPDFTPPTTLATPATTTTAAPLPPPTSAPAAGSDAGGSFETATPSLPPAAGGTPAPVATQPVADGSGLRLGPSIPVLLVAVLLLGAPLFAAGANRLATESLAAGSESQPGGSP